MMLPGRLLDHRGRPDHEELTQSLVAGTGYLAEPGLSGGGMALWGQAEPGGKQPPRAEGARTGRLLHHRGRRNRTNAGGLAPAPAKGIGAVPGPQPGPETLP